jgi:hypothetical protein
LDDQRLGHEVAHAHPGIERRRRVLEDELRVAPDLARDLPLMAQAAARTARSRP